MRADPQDSDETKPDAPTGSEKDIPAWVYLSFPILGFGPLLLAKGVSGLGEQIGLLLVAIVMGAASLTLLHKPELFRARALRRAAIVTAGAGMAFVVGLGLYSLSIVPGQTVSVAALPPEGAAVKASAAPESRGKSEPPRLASSAAASLGNRAVSPPGAPRPPASSGSSALEPAAAPTSTPAPAETVPPILVSEESNRVVVRPGDSLWRIARRAYGKGADYAAILRANEGLRPDRLVPGQELIVPPLTTAAP
jgi:LysM repeat protein